MFENRRWLVIPTSITGSINFDEVYETSIETLRLSIDETQTFVKYDDGQRPSIYDPQYTEYNHADILALLSTEAWTSPIEEI